ncbi:MAG: dTDP-4-dehydrorhamnose reductase [Verrucomicrobiaceae bacterium]|nr:dTDP-4-dehydrorhamnose reductase [Verrucomicrobiaceae bacterium]
MNSVPRVVVLGAKGRLGRVLKNQCADQNMLVKALGRTELDLALPDSIPQALEGLEFDWLINAAGTTDVDDCERHPKLAHVVNAEATGALARACVNHGARLLQISTDYVFGGDSRALLTEQDVPAPVNAYGQTKLEGEQAAMAEDRRAVVARVSWLFGGDKQSFPDGVVMAGLAGDAILRVNDKWACPTYVEDLARWLLWLVEDGSHAGVIHLCNQGVASWSEYAQVALDLAGELGLRLRTTHVEGHTMEGFDRFIAKRPPFTALDTGLFTRLSGIAARPWQEALAEYLKHRYTR